MKKINFGSPSKQNTCPYSPNRKKKMDSFSEIVAFLQNSGINLPSHINKIISSGFNPESPLKPIAVSNRQSNQLNDKRIKIQLTDCQFQLKKVQEDFADFKRNTKLQKQRESRRFEETLNKLKSSIQFANQDGAYTVDKMKKEAELQLKTLKQKHQLQLRQQIDKLNQKYKIKLENQQKLKLRQINELLKNSEAKYNQKVKDYEQIIEAFNKRYTQQLKDLTLRHKQVIDQKEKRYQSNFLAVQSQKKTQQKLHQKTKLQYSKEREKIISDLCFQRNISKQLEEDIERKDKEIKRLKNQIKDVEVNLILKEQKHKKKILQIQNNYQNKYKQHEKESQSHLKTVTENYRKDIQALQQRLNNTEIIQQEKQELLLSNIEELSMHFHKRPSKPEDVSEIEKLKWALVKKDEEVRKLKQDLKHTNLQSQNKEQIYNRIFRGNSMSRQKKGHLKDQRGYLRDQKEKAIMEQKLGKQTLFRKSQTADIKFILKAYNNNKNY